MAEVEFSNKPWSQFRESDYKDAAQFCKACLIDLNPPGQDPVKANCKLPVREPKKGGGLGPYNINAIFAAAAALAGARGGVKAPPEAKRKAARKLIRLYRLMKEKGLIDRDPPESLRRIASE